MADARRRPTRGFTLIELAGVMVIVGILISFILVAAQGGVRRAEERATQALLAKLDAGMTDRMESLLSIGASPTPVHQGMAQVLVTPGGNPVAGPRRAQVIALYDMIRAEVPDVFSVMPPSSGANYGPDDYPLNFAGAQSGSVRGNPAYILPLGAVAPGTGIYGASYTAAAGIYKNLGYLPAGYDGVDNNDDPGGLIDEFGEAGITSAALEARLDLHRHKTARSEMLYAVLVEGQGPLGSVFAADDFTDREVGDTDGDGLPEFIDAWGEPLQFYRWPILYRSDLQKGLSRLPGAGQYANTIEPREQNPLDPNQQLVAPAWWSNRANLIPGGSAPLSAGAVEFQRHFHLLLDPRTRGVTAGLPNATFWDRGSTYYQRRAYSSKFLIVSSGPDREPGIGRWDVPSTSLTAPQLLLESQAAQATLARIGGVYQEPDPARQAETAQLEEAGLDDITNHNLLSTGGGTQ